VKAIRFEHKGEEYEIRVVSDGATVYVRAFKDSKPANGYKYSVDVPTMIAIEDVVKTDIVEDLIEVARRDITRNR